MSTLQARIAECDGFIFVVDALDSLGLGSAIAFEPDTLAALQRLVQPGWQVLDIGANVGYFTAHLSRLVGESGGVYAFEPAAGNFALLSENKRRNRLDNVTLHQLAVGDSEGSAQLHLSDSNAGMHRLYDSVCCSGPFESVAVVRLDSLLGDQTVDLIKIDIEGFEYSALKGAEACLTRNRQLRIISEYSPLSLLEAGTPPSQFLHYLGALGFMAHTLAGEAIACDELHADASKYEAYGRDRFLQLTRGLQPYEIAAKVMEIASALGCKRPILENLLFVRA